MAEERVPVLETKCLGIQFGGLKAVNDVNIETVSYTHLTLPTILRV